jgi:putative transposase
MDEEYLPACARYVERNPVRAKLCGRPPDWPWSSASAHLSRKDDTLVHVRPLLELVPNWSKHLSTEPAATTLQELRRHESTGRPAGSERFVKRLERLLGRVLRPGKPGRKRKNAEK